ncbi:MAG: GNAT family N-acetyltransferase [bacterium]|nr:GNAT family N-acetyltransferase [bacterium]
MTPSHDRVIRLAESQRRKAEETLARSFFNDPMARYILPTVSQRLGGLRWFFRTGLRYGLRYGAVDTTGNGAGVAVWFRPNYTAMNWIRMLRTGMLAAPMVVGLRAARRLLTFFHSIDSLHGRLVPEPHWYLLSLGVAPERQGQGLGGALLRHGLERAQAEGLPCYLETTNERNVPFYERHGFRFVAQGEVTDGGPHVWAMLREF